MWQNGYLESESRLVEVSVLLLLRRSRMSASVFDAPHEEGRSQRRREPDHPDSVAMRSADRSVDRGPVSGPAGSAVAGVDGAVRSVHEGLAGAGDDTGRRVLHIVAVRPACVQATC